MKKYLILLLIFLGSILIANAQDGPPVPPGTNVTVDWKGNFHEIADTKTDRIYFDKNGNAFPVFLSKNGKFYAITGISKKTGKPIRKYLKP